MLSSLLCGIIIADLVTALGWSGGERASEELRGFILGLSILASLGVLLGLRRIKLPWDEITKLLGLTAVWALLSGLIGVARGAPLSYLAGDTFKALVIPVTYLLTASVVSGSSGSARVIKGLVMVYFARAAILLVRPRTLPGDYVLPTLVVALTLTGRLGAVFGPRLWRVLALAAGLTSIFALLESGRRAPILAILVAGAVSTALQPGIARRLKALAGLSAGIGLVAWLPIARVPFERWLSTITVGEAGIQIEASAYGRISEVKAILNEFELQGWGWILTGVGAGALYSNPEEAMFAPANIVVPETIMVHNVHVGPVGILYRQGIVGFVLWLWLCLAVLKEVVKLRRRSNVAVAIGAAFVAEQLVFLTASFFVGKPEWGILLGVLSADAPEARRYVRVRL